jgi:hypothetical protein
MMPVRRRNHRVTDDLTRRLTSHCQAEHPSLLTVRVRVSLRAATVRVARRRARAARPGPALRPRRLTIGCHGPAGVHTGPGRALSAAGLATQPERPIMIRCNSKLTCAPAGGRRRTSLVVLKEAATTNDGHSARVGPCPGWGISVHRD